MKEDITPNFPPDQPVKLIHVEGILPATDLDPTYYYFLREAHHNIYIALEEMLHTPCVTFEQFGKVIDIYNDLGDYISKREGDKE